MPGGKTARGVTPSRRRAYERMKASGMPKGMAARIANAGKTKAGRKAMSRKAARSR